MPAPRTSHSPQQPRQPRWAPATSASDAERPGVSPQGPKRWQSKGWVPQHVPGHHPASGLSGSKA
ncbi:hypothetical protein KUCAC02_019904, partial [Chaenocephalus aceratus]